MSDFKDWNALIEDADELGGLACYTVSVLLAFYGTDRPGSNTNQHITDALARRGYSMQPRSITGLAPDSWVRVYKNDTALGKFLNSMLDVSPLGNTDLRRLERKLTQDDNIRRLIQLAKSIAEE